MAFSFANVASEAAALGGGSAQPGVQMRDGEELKEIQTGQLGFKTINAEVKVRLLPSPWAPEDPPIPSAQLLSVASSQSILAAAGPDVLIIASTDGIREILSAKEGGDIRDVSPILSLPHDRLTHVVFSSDESVLVVSGTTTNGLVVYQVDKLKAGNSDPALRVSVAGTLRALVPNPNPQAAHLFALVDADGQLLIADLSMGQIVEGPDSTVLSQSITCVSWSNRGKQLVAGTASGTAVQLKPNGQIVAHIPKSTSIPDDVHMSVVAWLEDDTFLATYTPDNADAQDGIPPSDYYIIERSNKTSFTFHKIPEVLPPFGVERLPTHHFITRLRKFDPHITDLLLLSATSATDIGIISKSDEPLSTSDNQDDQVSNAFTLTSLEDDTKRAALPLSAESLDPSPIGLALDLSSKEPVINQLPSDPEIQQTTGPVPNLLALNNEGLLCSWWIIYSDSVKQKTTFSGFDSLKTNAQIRSSVSPPPEGESNKEVMQITNALHESKPSASQSFATSTTTAPSPFGGANTQSAFGAPKLQPSWSSFGNGSGFGASSTIGEEKSSWTNTGFSSNTSTSNSSAAFGQSGFGQVGFGTPSTSSNAGTPAFGSTTAFGNKAVGFGHASSLAFGKTNIAGGSTSSPFSTAGTATTGAGFSAFAGSGGFGFSKGPKDESKQDRDQKQSGGGFSSFASASGFGAITNKTDESKQTSFGKSTSTTPSGGFGSSNNSESPFTKTSSAGTFGQSSLGGDFGKSQPIGTTVPQNPGAFGLGTPFKLESSFKGDGSAKDDLPALSTGSSFDMGIGSLLSETKKELSPTQNVETEMDDREDDESGSDHEDQRPFGGFPPQPRVENDVSKKFITPPSTITHPKTTPAPPVSNIFDPPQQPTTTPQQAFPGIPFPSTTPKETPSASNTLFGTKPITTFTPAAVQKSEPVKSFDAVKDVQLTTTTTEGKASEKNQIPSFNSKPLSGNADKSELMASMPLPPDPVSKPDYATGDTSASSANSKESKDPEDAPLPPDFLSSGKPVGKVSKTSKEEVDAPLPPDFVPANKSAMTEVEEVHIPEGKDDDSDEDEFSSEFDDSGEDVTDDVSATAVAEIDQDEDATTEQLQTSPESSYKGGDTTSPTGGLFTKVSAHDMSKASRPLFGEVGRAPPVFPPPKTQQSPRSPSPVRPIFAHDTLRSDNRSVSAPIRPGSAIDQRKADYSQSSIGLQAARAREEESSREKGRLAALKAATDKAKAKEVQALEDDEDERIQRELALPVQPKDALDEYITYQASAQPGSHKIEIPAQIERLYQDINSMICTIGINARSLTAFMMFQQNHSKNESWPGVLQSEEPMDAMKGDWPLNDIKRVYEGTSTLAVDLDQIQVQEVSQKLDSCQSLLTKDLFELRTKITAIRKSLHVNAHGSPATAPLSAEQASVQHDLRKASASVQTRLVQIEDDLAIMRARFTEIVPLGDASRGHKVSDSPAVQKKPTVEAVTNTIAKMTSMAERKSADIDVLEAQLKKYSIASGASQDGGERLREPTTPRRTRTPRAVTPGSSASSLFYTPDSKVQASARSTRSNGGNQLLTSVISAEDRDRWQARATRKKTVVTTLKAVLEDKRRKTLAAST